MEDALELAHYLPVSYKTRPEGEYIEFLWDAFQTNYTSGKYEFSSFAFHLLYMSFVSFAVWQIRSVRESDFKKALIGLELKSEKSLLDADTPFKFYEKLREFQIFRFLKLIGCENDQVGEFSKFGGRRNKIAHPSGSIFFNDQVSIDLEIRSIMREVVNIQRHMRPIILEVYRGFLEGSANIEEREYSDPKQQVEVCLIHQNYISQRDIDTCLEFDLLPLRSEANFSTIETLHQFLRKTYGEVGETVSAP